MAGRFECPGHLQQTGIHHDRARTYAGLLAGYRDRCMARQAEHAIAGQGETLPGRLGTPGFQQREKVQQLTTVLLVDGAKMARMTEAVWFLIPQCLDVDRPVFRRHIRPIDFDFQVLVFRLLTDLDRKVRSRQYPETLARTIEQADGCILERLPALIQETIDRLILTQQMELALASETSLLQFVQDRLLSQFLADDDLFLFTRRFGG